MRVYNFKFTQEAYASGNISETEFYEGHYTYGLGGFMGYVASITKDGTLHLYEDKVNVMDRIGEKGNIVGYKYISKYARK